LEKVSLGLPALEREPSPSPVFRRVVEHVTTLAERFQVAGPVVARVMIQVRGRQENPCRANGPISRGGGRHTARRMAVPAAPDLRLRIPPGAIAQVAD